MERKKKSSKIEYIDRETGNVCQEIVYGERELRILYESTYGKFLRAGFASRSWFSSLNGVFKRINNSNKKINDFINRYDVNVSEIEKPLEQFNSLDNFFTRKLKSSSRPICYDSGTLVAPCDGRALVFKIEADGFFPIKGHKVSVTQLLKNQNVSEELLGGTVFIIRLAPKDYHRFHFPMSGLASQAKLIKGKLESVHPIALQSGSCSFLNKRMITKLRGALGEMYLVEVGALTVGTIVQTYQSKQVQKGDEKGYFRFGGSTIVLLWDKKGPKVDGDLIENSSKGIETFVKFGTQIAQSSQVENKEPMASSEGTLK